jgi:uncharacterized protein YndB with AHSA1/START domain
MPSVVDHATAAAPPEEVWKLLYDPSRFPEWWAGMERIEIGPGDGDFTYWYEGWPDVAMRQHLTAQRPGTRVTMSCLISHVQLEWVLSEDGGGTRIDVHAAIPEEEGAREPSVRASLAESLRRLVAVATDELPAPG